MMIIDFCEKYDMLPRGALVLCAVSGGKDSMYLLSTLMELRSEMGFKIACAHFDHRLRGAESDRDRRFVEGFCAEKGLSCYVGGADVAAYAAELKLGIEEAARKLRYEFLEKTAEEIGASRIATAHTADDNAETLLLNLSRGSGLKGLCGIPPVRGLIVRPLLETGTDEILAYLKKYGIPHVEDSTNAGDDYARNRLRHRVLPRLREQNPAFERNLIRCVSLLREDEDFLSALAEDFIKENYSESSLPAEKLVALKKPVSTRVLKSIAKGELSMTHIEAILKISASDAPHAAADVPGLRVRREYDRLVFGGEESKGFSPAAIKMGETLYLAEAGLKISSEFIENCKEIHNSDNTFFFENDSICGNIVVTARKEGDKIRLLGRNCTKTLKKLFSETGLNGMGKALVPVLRDDKGPVAVYGFGIAHRCAGKPGDDVICVTLRPAP